MATFRVGQSIKKVRGSTNVGDIAVVVAMSVDGRGPETIEVKRNKSWVNRSGALMPKELTSYTNRYDWAPLTDANDLVSWESMREKDLWVPEQYRVVA